MDDLIGELKKLGLTINESKVYVALLEVGMTTSKAIIDRSNLHRQTVYDSLASLLEKGLVSFVIQANRKYFKAVNPKQIGDYFTRKEEEINKQRSLFKKILPRLENLPNELGEDQEATIYQGNKGIKSLLNDMIEEKKEILTIGASDVHAKAFEYNLQFNLPRFHIERQRLKIPLKILFSENLKHRMKELSKLNYTKSKLLPKEFTSNSSTNIYGNKLSLILWGSQPFGVLIKSKEIADAQRKYFNELWKIAKK